MSKRNVGPLMAVGLVFGAAGHELVIDQGQAHAASPPSGLEPLVPRQTVQDICEPEASSGCLLELSSPSTIAPPTLSDLGETYCWQASDDGGSSGLICSSVGG